MDISFVIINWNTKDLLLKCIASIYETVVDHTFEIWLVDNASTDGSVEAVSDRFSAVSIIRNKENLGFARANNKALEQINGRYAVLLNSDTILTRGAIDTLFTFMEDHTDAGMACGQLLNEDGSAQNSFANFPTIPSLIFNESLLRLFSPWKYKRKKLKSSAPFPVESGIGACLMVRKAAISTAGLLDERYFFFFEETDWAHTMKKKGWESWMVPTARIYHLQGQSVGHSLKSRILFYESRYKYFKKWYPHAYSVVPFLVMARLGANISLNAAGIVLTLGLVNGMKEKFTLYFRLLAWHWQNRNTLFAPDMPIKKNDS
ncbi:MAG: glycosyltransferase family 2 protein [Thermodesulfobacteriota bacterium]|nr:glycosyltransferase family 2 protein [Thermodesulfobacteriota bacterium]